jgi:methylase of polypeptide subunit release factors
MGVCRSVSDARRELSWLEEEVLNLNLRESTRLFRRYKVPVPRGEERDKWQGMLLRRMVSERARGMPLQYVVGSPFLRCSNNTFIENQPFGGLSIHVRPGVFIPRWETEEWGLALARRLRSNVRRPFTLVDLCSGSGCIPLLLKEYVSAEGVDELVHGKANHLARFVGIESSPIAIAVARQNLKLLHPQTELFPDSSSPQDSPLTLGQSTSSTKT